MPQISVIVPVYRVERYLPRCLDSIVAQTFMDWECILIDDGSPDNSGAICDEYAKQDSRFVVIHQENAGVSAARNAGLAAARGEWIAFVDSDDWIDRETYEVAYNHAVKCNADMVQWGYCRSDGQGDYDHRVFKHDYDISNFKDTLKEDEPYFGFCFTMTRRQLLLDNDIFFPADMIMGEDYLFSLRCYLATTNIYNIKDKCFYHYFQRSDSACHNTSERYRESQIYFIKQFEDIVERSQYARSFMTVVNRHKASFKIRMLKDRNFEAYRNNFVEVESRLYNDMKIFRPAMFFVSLNMDCLARLYLDLIRLAVTVKRKWEGKR